MRYLLVLGFIALLAYLATGITQVRPGERAVIRRFGRVLDDKPGPGLHLGLPWGMDRVDKVEVDKLRRVVIGGQSMGEELGQMLTGDRNLVGVQAIVNYTIKPDEQSVVQFTLQAEQADSLVARAAESVLTEWMAGSKVDEVLLGDRVDINRRLMEETQRRMDDYQLGVRIQAASTTSQAPDPLKDAFESVNRAHAEIDRKINDAQAQADQKVQNAEAEKVRIVQAARATAEDIARQGDVELRTFEKLLALYQQAGDKRAEMLRLIWHEEMSKLAAHMAGRIEVLDDRLNNGSLEITTFAPRPARK